MRSTENPRVHAGRKRWVFWPRRRKLLVDEDGSVTVEFIIWIPVFMLILALTIDASTIFKTQSNMWGITRDTTRNIATGRYNNASGENYARDKAALWGYTASVTATTVGDYVSVKMEIPISDVSLFNIIGAFSSGNITTELVQRLEP